MTDVKEFITAIVSPLVNHPEDIQLNMQETDDFYEYLLSVHPDDVGRIIGRKGRIAKSIRTIVYSVRTPGPKRIRLTIEDAA